MATSHRIASTARSPHAAATHDPPSLSAQSTGTTLRVLGPWGLHHDGPRPEVRLREQRVLAYLAVHGDSSRATVAGSLWPDTTEIRALANLRSSVFRLRQLPVRLLDVTPSRLGLGEAVGTDVGRLLALLDELEHHPRAIDSAALTLLGARPLLEAWGDDWIVAERQPLLTRQVAALCAAARSAYRSKAAEATIQAAALARRLDPLLLDPHELLIRIHLALGDVATALLTYRSYESLLRRELGVAPSHHLARLLGLTRADAQLSATYVDNTRVTLRSAR